MMRRSDEREADFLAAVVTLARLCGFLVYHTHDSRRSAPGFPDLVLVRGPRIIFAELKTSRGKLRPEQHVWLAALAQCPGVEVALWRSADWPIIEQALIHGERLPCLTALAPSAKMAEIGFGGH